MKEREFRRLITKYLDGECTPEERDFLEKTLDSVHGNNQHRLDLNFEVEAKQRIWSKIQSQTLESETTGQEHVRRFSFLSMAKVAAVLAGVAISVVIWSSLRSGESEQLVYADDQIILRSGNSAYEIQTEDFGQLKNDKGEAFASQQGDVIVYKTNTVKELIYNEIEVPNGKRIQILLSDGTSVHLNSNSVFKFPVNFLKGQDRKVFLTGEAYFEVAKDAAHPFSVDANEMRVSVLGTHFNVSSYAGSIPNAVLLEGSVTIQERNGGALAGEVQKLIPGQKATVVSGGIEVNEVDVDNYVGWMNGTMIFDNEPFAEIVKKIERHYNVNIELNNDGLASLRFKGKFQEESIIDLLDTFKESAGFTYKISDNKVIIN